MTNRMIITKRYNDNGSEPETIYAPMSLVGASDRPTQQLNRYNSGANMVNPTEVTAVAKRGAAQLLPVQDTRHTIDVPLAATQHIEMKTSAVDRSKGFLIANVPLFGAFALGVWLLSGLLTSSGFFTLTGLVILWLSFVAAWLASYYYTLRVSAEGIAMFESEMKWKVIMREQDRRWAYYEASTKDGR